MVHFGIVIFSFLYLTQLFYHCNVRCQLIVNVKNNGGDIYRESINANTTDDTVSLEFRKADGTIVTQFIDGKNEVQIFKMIVLPEEERGQTQIQTMCFVFRFGKNEFISSDAMSKLRQKNPSAIRHPEEIRSEEIIQLDLMLNVSASNIISSHVQRLCSDANDMTFISDGDLRLLSQILNRDIEILQSVTQKSSFDKMTSCQNVVEAFNSCVCHYDVCVGWYPCGLKYCHGKDSANRNVNYRCGIKTCSKCRVFEFVVRAKHLCIWDEAEFTLDNDDDQQHQQQQQQEEGEGEQEEPESPLVASDAEENGVGKVPSLVKLSEMDVGVVRFAETLPKLGAAPPPLAEAVEVEEARGGLLVPNNLNGSVLKLEEKSERVERKIEKDVRNRGGGGGGGENGEHLEDDEDGE